MNSDQAPPWVLTEENIGAVTLLDTAVASTNLGDGIIMDAAETQLTPLLSNSFIYRVASHDWMGGKSRALVGRSRAAVVCGTNLLSSRMWVKPLWKLSPADAFRQLNVTLLGAGWYQHQRAPDAYTRWLLGRVLSQTALHSVRDGYSRRMLMQAGIKNVVNTGCPTLWGLTQEHCAGLPKSRAENVVTTINTYFKNPEADKKMLLALKENYQNIFFWVQTETDYQYAIDLDVPMTILKPSLSAFDDLLQSEVSLDYVGNRLHAGIRAMQYGRRSIIVEVDNRALEMGADFNLPTVARDDFAKLGNMIQSGFETRLKLPFKEIEQWKSQFEGL